MTTTRLLSRKRTAIGSIKSVGRYWKGYGVKDCCWNPRVRRPVLLLLSLTPTKRRNRSRLVPGIAAEKQFARHLAENGFEVVVPTLVDRSSRWSGHPDIGMTDQPHREWIYRQAFHMGRHIIGYEVQKVLAAVDWFQHKNGGRGKIGVAGYAEGGLIAFYAAAIDTRIDAALVSGYFNTRQQI